MNNIVKQYHKFLNTIEKILNLTGIQKFKIKKVKQWVICLNGENDKNIEISTANHIVNHCPNVPIKRILFYYDGIEINPINEDEHILENKNINIAIAYNGKEIDFFSFIIDCLSTDYKNPKKNGELSKTLDIAKMTLYLEKFITDPFYTRRLYDYINPNDLVQPLINTMGAIKNFLEQTIGYDFTFLSANENGDPVCKIVLHSKAKAEENCVTILDVRKENQTISFNIVGKNITISKDDISKQENNILIILVLF